MCLTYFLNVDLTGPYDVVPNWMKTIDEGVTTHVIGVFAESPDRILATSTGATPGQIAVAFNPKVPGAKLDHLMMVLDRNGRVVEEWRHWYGLWGNPHVARINPYDPDKHVWFIDRESSQIFVFTNDGKSLVRTFGEKGVAAADERHFGRPAEIAWLPDGTFFVADGYQNRRVVKFDKDGRYVTAWGSQGSGPGQFGGIVHCVAVDANRRVYVSDAGNRRIQIFDEFGKFIEEWPIPGPVHMMVDRNQAVLKEGQMDRIAEAIVRKTFLALCIIASAFELSALPSFAQQTPTAADLQGTWKLVSLSFDGQPQKATGYIVFHGGHYSFITNRVRPTIPNGAGDKPPSQLNAEEVNAYVEAFRNMTAAAGPYSTKGDEILLVMEVVRTPNLTGQTEERKSWLENGRLVQDFMGGGRRQIYV